MLNLKSYTIGSSETITPGDALVYQSKGSLIYVSIQYRLGVCGFLGGAELLADGVANAGLLDQRAALSWVQRHISQFGSDPSKVTIIGGSVGGGSVTDQMTFYDSSSNPPFGAVVADTLYFFYTPQGLFGDFIISCPSYYMATAVSDSRNPIYKMIFNAGTELHGSFIAFTETFNLNGSSNNATITNGQSSLLVLNVTYTDIDVAPDQDASAQYDFFHGQSYVVRN
ncbi:hypothetical protein B7463_g2215, partial [Scytalidium lignicola]